MTAASPMGLKVIEGLERKLESAINDLKSQVYVSILPELCPKVLSLLAGRMHPGLSTPRPVGRYIGW